MRAVLGNHLKAGNQTVAEATALFARFTTPPTPARRILINNLILALQSAGVWTLLDAFYVMAAETAQAAQMNWKVATFPLTPVSAPTFTVDRGYAGDGLASHLTTGYTPSTAGLGFTLNSAHLSLWSRTEIASGTAVPIGSRTLALSAQTLIIPRSGTDTASARINQDTAGLTPASTTSIGQFTMRRNGAATSALFRNGVSVGADVEVSTTLSTAGITLGALNTGGVVANFATHQMASASIGASLSDAQTLAFYNAVQVYMTAVGA